MPPPTHPSGSRAAPDFPATSPQRPAPLSDAARHAVFRVLARQAKLYPDFDLSVMDKSALESPLSELDRAFAYAIYDAVVRRWLTLEFLLSRELTARQPWAGVEPRVKAALLGGAAQILFMDRVPTHAAINHAVEWAKQVVRPGAGGFVNAVLRRFATLKPAASEPAPPGAASDPGVAPTPATPHTHPTPPNRRPVYTGLRDELPADDGTAIVLTQACLPEDDIARLAVATAHPEYLIRHWLMAGGGSGGGGGGSGGGGGLREARRLALHSLVRPPVILNTMHARTPPPPAPTCVPHAFPGHHVFTGSAAELAALLSVRDDLWVQDPGSAQAVQSVSDLRPALVLDLCAGQGTKTRQLAAVFPSAKIIATDVDAARLASLERTFARSERVSVLPRRAIQDKYIGKADLILLDVPCSNTGVLARRPEARLRFDPAHLKQLIDVQRQIIADSIPLLSEGRGGGGGGGGGRGKILYSTCSLEAMENIDQVRWADHWHRLGISRDRRQSPEGLPADPPPHVQYCDGSFAALLG